MSKLRKGLILALEEMENEMEGETPVEEVGDVDEARLEAEEAHEEVSEAETEIDEMSDTVEDAEQDIETLDAIGDTMESTIESGEGMTEDAAEIAEVAIEAIFNRLGIKRQERLLPATESFGSTNSRLAATKLSLEVVREGAAKAVEAVKKFFAMIAEKIVQFFGMILKNADALKKHIQAVQSKVNDVKGKTASKEFLEKTALAKALGGEKEAADASTAKEKIDNVQMLLAHGKKVSEALKSAFEKPIDDLEANVKIINDLNEQIPAKAPFLGGLILKTLKSKYDKHMNKINLEAGIDLKAEQLKTLTPEEMTSLLKDCTTLADSIKEYKSVEKINQATMKAVEKKVKEAEDKAGKEGELSEGEKMLKSIYTDAGDIMTKTSVNFASLAFKTVKAVTTYVEASVAVYGEAPSEEAAPEAKAE